MLNFLEFPSEVISLIIVAALPSRFSPPMIETDEERELELFTLRNLSLVNRFLRKHCIPFLFDTITFQATDHQKSIYVQPDHPFKEMITTLKIKVGNHYDHEQFLRIAQELKEFIKEGRKYKKLHVIRLALFPNMTDNDVVQSAMEDVGTVVKEYLTTIDTVILETDMMRWSFNLAFSIIQNCKNTLRRLEWIDDTANLSKFFSILSIPLNSLTCLFEVTFSHVSNVSLSDVIPWPPSVRRFRLLENAYYVRPGTSIDVHWLYNAIHSVCPHLQELYIEGYELILPDPYFSPSLPSPHFNQFNLPNLYRLGFTNVTFSIQFLNLFQDNPIEWLELVGLANDGEGRVENEGQGDYEEGDDDDGVKGGQGDEERQLEQIWEWKGGFERLKTVVSDRTLAFSGGTLLKMKRRGVDLMIEGEKIL